MYSVTGVLPSHNKARDHNPRPAVCGKDAFIQCKGKPQVCSIPLSQLHFQTCCMWLQSNSCCTILIVTRNEMKAQVTLLNEQKGSVVTL